MSKQYSIDAVLNYSWEQAVAAFWLRYPNPFSQHVLTEDVIDRYIDNSGRLHTRRLFKKTNSMPKWGAVVVPKSANDVWIVEDSVCDVSGKVHQARTVNIGLSNIMVVEEKSYLSQASSLSTLWRRNASATSNVYGVASALKMFAIERYKRNATSAYKGFNMVLNELYGGSASMSKASEFSKQIRKLEKLRASALKAGEIAGEIVDKGEELVHSGLGAAGKSSGAI